MTISTARTDCKSEREIVVQGFSDLLRVLKVTKKQNEENIQKFISDIEKDITLSEEERRILISPYYDLLSEQEESDIRIRRTILIGLFSLWELSLKNICEYYHIDGGTTIEQKTTIRKRNNHRLYSVNDYITAIFNRIIPHEIEIICTQIKELRNYMTHGKVDNKRQIIIDSLIVAHPEFCIIKKCEDYCITSYNGLECILNCIYNGLQLAEKTAKTKLH